jgi:hypothetical protein
MGWILNFKSSKSFYHLLRRPPSFRSLRHRQPPHCHWHHWDLPKHWRQKRTNPQRCSLSLG